MGNEEDHFLTHLWQKPVHVLNQLLFDYIRAHWQKPKNTRMEFSHNWSRRVDHLIINFDHFLVHFLVKIWTHFFAKTPIFVQCMMQKPCQKVVQKLDKKVVQKSGFFTFYKNSKWLIFWKLMESTFCHHFLDHFLDNFLTTFFTMSMWKLGVFAKKGSQKWVQILTKNGSKKCPKKPTFWPLFDRFLTGFWQFLSLRKIALH